MHAALGTKLLTRCVWAGASKHSQQGKQLINMSFVQQVLLHPFVHIFCCLHFCCIHFHNPERRRKEFFLSRSVRASGKTLQQCGLIKQDSSFLALERESDPKSRGTAFDFIQGGEGKIGMFPDTMPLLEGQATTRGTSFTTEMREIKPQLDE
jgi:hypothetical protein